jgi:hypothetical protein
VPQTNQKLPNPRRMAAGRENRKKRGPLTPAARQRLREAALRHQPWKHASGPRTPAGKARAASNGKVRQIGPRSVREIRADLADVADLIRRVSQSRGTIEQAVKARRETRTAADR